MTLEIGKQLGPYKILGSAGAGGMGEVSKSLILGSIEKWRSILVVSRFHGETSSCPMVSWRLPDRFSLLLAQNCLYLD